VTNGYCLAHSGITNTEYCISCYDKMDGAGSGTTNSALKFDRVSFHCLGSQPGEYIRDQVHFLVGLCTSSSKGAGFPALFLCSEKQPLVWAADWELAPKNSYIASGKCLHLVDCSIRFH